MPFHRKSIRLPALNYLGLKIHFVTICCDARLPHFRDPWAANLALATLSECAANFLFHLHAYCAMPDHLHFLAHGIEPECNLLEFVRVFKQRTAFNFKQATHHRLWMMSFYDHILRKGDELEAVACYIWANPVRKQLCDRPEEYPFSGSQTIDWIKKAKERQSHVPPWTPRWPV